MGDAIRLSIVGLGNCASSLVTNVVDFNSVGAMHDSLGGYEVSDISPVCAFEVDERKIDADVETALEHNTNCEDSLAADFEMPIYRGPVFDGVATHMDEGDRDTFVVDEERESVDVAQKLREHDVDVLVNYLPVGSQRAVEHYAEACLETGVAFVNAMPVFIASDKEWANRFEAEGVPVVGDDIKSQVGATIVHRSLMEMIDSRGAEIDHTYQLNVGGNTDFKNMLDRERLKTKKRSKTKSVNSQLGEEMDDEDIHIGPSDYVDWMDDNKVAFVRIEGELFGGASFDIDLRLSVEDSPNSTGSAVDAIRGAKVALDEGIGGSIDPVSAFTMKHPPVQMPDQVGKERLEEFTGDD